MIEWKCVKADEFPVKFHFHSFFKNESFITSARYKLCTCTLYTQELKSFVYLERVICTQHTSAFTFHHGRWPTIHEGTVLYMLEAYHSACNRMAKNVAKSVFFHYETHAQDICYHYKWAMGKYKKSHRGNESEKKFDYEIFLLIYLYIVWGAVNPYKKRTLQRQHKILGMDSNFPLDARWWIKIALQQEIHEFIEF